MADFVRVVVFGMQRFNNEHLSHFFSYRARGVTQDAALILDGEKNPATGNLGQNDACVRSLHALEFHHIRHAGQPQPKGSDP